MHHHTGLHGETLPCFWLYFLVILLSYYPPPAKVLEFAGLKSLQHGTFVCNQHTNIVCFFLFLEHVFPKTRGRLVCHIA